MFCSDGSANEIAIWNGPKDFVNNGGEPVVEQDTDTWLNNQSVLELFHNTKVFVSFLWCSIFALDFVIIVASVYARISYCLALQWAWLIFACFTCLDEPCEGCLVALFKMLSYNTIVVAFLACSHKCFQTRTRSI
jgi:hypothetical protein